MDCWLQPGIRSARSGPCDIRQLRLRLVVPAVDHKHLADELDRLSITGFEQPLGKEIALIPVQNVDLHLDELMVLQGAIGFGDHAITQTTITDDYDWLQVMGDLAKLFPGCAVHVLADLICCERDILENEWFNASVTFRLPEVGYH